MTHQDRPDLRCSLEGCNKPAIGRYGLRLNPEITRDVQLCSDCFTAANKNDLIAYTIGLAHTE